MGMLDSYKKKRADKKALKDSARDGYTLMVADQVHDLRETDSNVLKLVRGRIEAEVVRFRKKHGDLVHPETGETPELVFVIPKPDSTEIQMRLVTDSQPLRDWLAAKGLAVHGEVVNGELVDGHAVDGEVKAA